MNKTQAKRLKVGEDVLCDNGRTGTVIRKRYGTIWIRWADGAQTPESVDDMEDVWTQEQIDAIVREKIMVEKLKQIQQERLQTHRYGGEPI